MIIFITIELKSGFSILLLWLNTISLLGANKGEIIDIVKYNVRCTCYIIL